MAAIAKRGNSWRVHIRRKGHEPITSTFATQREAQKFARDIESKIDASAYVDARPANEITLGGALRRYRRDVTPKKKSSVSEASMIDCWLRSSIAEKPFGKVTAAELIEWRDAAAAEGKSSSTIRNRLSMISKVYVHAAMDWGLPVNNPVRAVKLPPLDPPRERRLAADERARLEKWLLDAERYRSPDEPESEFKADRWVAQMVRLSLETAARAGELAGMEWKNVSWRDRVVLLKDTKINNETRAKPLSSVALNVLLFGPVWETDTVLPVASANTLSQAWERLRKRLGMPDMRLHDARHEATSRLFENTALRDIQIAAITGHSTLQMTKRYANLRVADLVDLLP